MFNQKQEKGLFTFYRQQAEQQQLLRFNKGKYQQHSPKLKHSKTLFSSSSSTQHKQGEHKNSRNIQVSNSESNQSKQQTYQYLKTIKPADNLHKINEHEETDQVHQKGSSNLIYPYLREAKEFDQWIFEKDNRFMDQIQNKSVSLKKITKTKNQLSPELKKHSNSVVLSRKGDYLNRRKQQITKNNPFKEKMIDQIKLKRKQQELLPQLFPLIHIDHNHSANYLIPKVKMKSKIIDKVFRLKNQKDIRKLRNQLQNEKLIEKEILYENLKNFNDFNKSHLVGKNSLLPSINQLKKQSQNQFSSSFTQQCQSYEFVNLPYSKALNEPSIVTKQPQNLMTSQRHQQLLNLLKRCKYHMNNG